MRIAAGVQRWFEQGSIIGIERQLLMDEWRVRSQELAAAKSKPIVLLAEADAAKFLAGFWAAVAADCPLVLGNPGWAIEEWRQVSELVRPGLVWAASELLLTGAVHPTDKLFNRSGSAPILIPTGGSSGKIRFAVHTWETLTASVDGFQKYFECEQINSCCVLPLYHVSGLMQVMRSVLTQGTLAIFPSKTLESSAAAFAPSGFFLSLVPTQLQRLLQNPDTARWLSQFQTVLLGGAPAWEALLQEARQYRIRLAPTYGMTETASQVVTLKPADFLSGKAGCGRVLPHAAIQILDETGSELPIGATGTIAIQAASLMLGYCPEQANESGRSQFLTDDLGYFDAQGYLHLVGRNSQKIITGGENVYPVEVEAAIRSTGLVKDVCVVGVEDRHWGEAVTAVCVAIDPQVSTAKLAAAVESRLAKYKRPKRWLLLPELPRSAQGKVNYSRIARLCADRT